MIGLDTNVLVRYLTQDDPVQSPQATRLIDSLDVDHPGYVSLPVVVELYWVLRSAYRLQADACATVLRELFDTQELVVQAEDAIRSALQSMNSAGLPDALIAELGRRAGCEHTVTFDRAAGRLANMRLLAAARRTGR